MFGMRCQNQSLQQQIPFIRRDTTHVKGVALLIGLLTLVPLATMTVAQPGASASAGSQVRIQFLIELPRAQQERQ